MATQDGQQHMQSGGIPGTSAASGNSLAGPAALGRLDPRGDPAVMAVIARFMQGNMQNAEQFVRIMHNIPHVIQNQPASNQTRQNLQMVCSSIVSMLYLPFCWP